MNISILGLGYVGATMFGCLSEMGHRVVGFDPAIHSMDDLLNSRAARSEQQLRELIEHGIDIGSCIAGNVETAIRQSDVTFICVGTPLQPNGGLSDAQVETVAYQIGKVLRGKPGSHIVVLRSTVMPGTTRAIERIIRTVSGRESPDELGVAFQPEFLREGSAVADFFRPALLVFGVSDYERVAPILESLYLGVEQRPFYLHPDEAEMLKLACNAFHALKVSFANEVGAICNANGINAGDVFDVFVQDLQLNISPAYLRPGFAYGGPCLPKDLAALAKFGGDLDLPLLRNVSVSNAAQIERAVRAVAHTNAKRVGIIGGIAHKHGTGDLRGSPALTLATRLLAEGYRVAAYDDSISRDDCSLCVESFDQLAKQSDVFIRLTRHADEELARVVGKRAVIDLAPTPEPVRYV
ncbi:GDP-mannose 6-dehydrogenase [Anaerolineae bacterium]|nr:GDP-mannose 6-dehydrogenase [Anaerolineae bacterium]